MVNKDVMEKRKDEVLVERWKRSKLGVCPTEKGRGLMVVRNKQIRGDHGEVFSLAAAKGYVWVCGPAVVGSVLLSVVQVTTKGQTDVCGLGCHWRPRG